MKQAIAQLVLALLFLSSPSVFGDTWVTTLPALPTPMGEVASALINNKIYVVGQNVGNTFVFDIAAGQWSMTNSQRPRPGNHHAVIVPGDGTMWLVGGLGSNSEGTVRMLMLA